WVQNPVHAPYSRPSFMPLFMPRHTVTLSERNGGARPGAARRIGLGQEHFLCPIGPDTIDPAPLRLYFVPADEKGLVAFDQVEQQSFIGDAPLGAGKGFGQGDVERDLAQADPVAVEPG